MRQIFITITIILVSWLLFVTSHFLISLSDHLLLELVNVSPKYYHTLTIDEILQHYPDFPYIVFGLFKYVYWSDVIWPFLCLALIFSGYKLFALPKDCLFKMVIFSLALFLAEGALALLPDEGLFKDKMIGYDLAKRQITYADSLGINKYKQDSKHLPSGYNINNQGFRSPYPFTKSVIDSLKQSSTVIMVIGDSYVDGCCAHPIDSSFVDLINDKEQYKVLNFGVGGTDLTQYELVGKEYIPALQPDVVITVLTNDFRGYKREAKPYQHLHYQTNYTWLDAHLPPTHSDYEPGKYFDDWQEAKTFYLNHFTVAGVSKSWLEKKFVLNFKINKLLYFVATLIQNKIHDIRHKYEYTNRFDYVLDSTRKITQQHLSTIKTVSENSNIPFLLFRAPTIKHTELDSAKAAAKYEKKIGDMTFHYPGTYKKKHFVSKQNDHFNNKGHRKFADFLIDQLANVDTK